MIFCCEVQWMKSLKKTHVRVLGRAVCCHLISRSGQDHSSIDQNVSGFILLSQCFWALVCKWHKRFSDGRVSKKDNVTGGRSYERALTLVRKVIDTDRCLTVHDTEEMYDLMRITMQCIFQMGLQTIEVYLVWRQNFLERIETYKIDNISTLHCDVKNQRITAPTMHDLVFLNWHNFINKPEDHWSCIANLSAVDMLKSVVIEEKK